MVHSVALHIAGQLSVCRLQFLTVRNAELNVVFSFLKSLKCIVKFVPRRKRRTHVHDHAASSHVVEGSAPGGKETEGFCMTSDEVITVHGYQQSMFFIHDY